ncbi:AI-2E family transporter [Parahaliea mediterranea]|uniref:AI-2E family transporter n=1 Tax=Parahaliea mediterranea TaxID=651086 RepID=A0A939DEG4_9GAMM|nr:AI-2E family transporter [Parahaliea mediterranea]MBN7796775.1 AI-2E family transporter [Parahaliea mediterranea]
MTDLRDTLVSIAALAVIIVGARYASPLLVPFLLSLFLAIVCGSSVNHLYERGWPHWLAVSGVIALVVALLAAPFLMVGSSLAEFREALPQYQQQFLSLLDSVTQWLAAHGVEVNENALQTAFNPGRAVAFFGGFVGGVGDTFSNVFIILLTVAFLLVDAGSFPRKLQLSRPGRHQEILATLQELVRQMNEYFVAKALVSLLTAMLIGAGLYLLDVRFISLWTLLAFLLNFIPVIGSIIAAIPVVALSLLELDPTLTLLLVLLYVSVNTVVGNIIEPAWMGHRMGLSTLAVFLSLIFWGWMFGPVGTLLSVPLTMVLRFIAERSPGATWVAVLLSAPPPANTGQESPTKPDTSGAPPE